MEVSLAPGMPHGHHFLMDSADRMDIDIDIDLGPIDEADAFQPVTNQSGLDIPQTEDNSGTTAQAHQADAENATPHKLHIRGLDDLTTDHINAFTAEHFPSDLPTRIEWIDDTSANIVFSTPAIALRALEQLTLASPHGALSELQLRPAKTFSANPASKLEIRLALVTDQKRPRAYEASRFYMMHPELDPREQRRRESKKHERTGAYGRRKYGRDEHRRRRQDDRDQGFEPNMYDDDAGALASRTRSSSRRRGSVSMHSANSSELPRSPREGRFRQGRGEEYHKLRTRDRSASPSTHDDRANDTLGRRDRRRTPPRAHSTVSRGLNQKENRGKELFPSKPALGTALNHGSKELFPNKKLAANLKKELFPTKAHTSHHRRSDAFDAADETADLFAKRLGFANGPSVTKGLTAVESTYGRLNADSNGASSTLESPTDSGLSIRGASKQKDQGFSIRGVAADGTRIGTIKELFPGRAGGNAGKELFAEKLQGRGGKRNRAEDMFY